MFQKGCDTSYVGFTVDGAKWLVENTDIKLVGRYKCGFTFLISGCSFPWSFFLSFVSSPIAGSSFVHFRFYVSNSINTTKYSSSFPFSSLKNQNPLLNC